MRNMFSEIRLEDIGGNVEYYSTHFFQSEKGVFLLDVPLKDILKTIFDPFDF